MSAQAARVTAGRPVRARATGLAAAATGGARRVPRPASVSGRGVRQDGSRAALNGSGRGRGETPKARGERTRHRVAAALIELLTEGDPAPTAKGVAGRAGVSVRLVFHHFEDMEALYRMVLKIQTERHWDTVRPVDPALSLDERIDRSVQQRAKLFDAVGAVRRTAVSIAARRDDIASLLAANDRQLRQWLESTFATELHAARAGKRDLLDAIDAAASFEVWDRLRRHQRLSASAARRVMGQALYAIVAS